MNCTPKVAYPLPTLKGAVFLCLNITCTNREFTADKPADKWPTDITELKCTDGKLYLPPILNVFNREIAACSLGRRANGEMAAHLNVLCRHGFGIGRLDVFRRPQCVAAGGNLAQAEEAQYAVAPSFGVIEKQGVAFLKEEFGFFLRCVIAAGGSGGYGGV